MGYIMAIMAFIFGYLSLSMFVSAYQETDKEEKLRLSRSGIGTFALTLMGGFYAWHFFS